MPNRRFPRFDEVSIQYEREVPATELVPLIEELSQDFFTVRTTRYTIRTAASGLFPDVAVIITFVAGVTVAHAFLQELGKDIYRSAREAIRRLYKRGAFWAPGAGRYLPLEIVVSEKDAQIRLVIDEGLSDEELDNLIGALGVFCGETLKGLRPEHQGAIFLFSYDQASQSWKRTGLFRQGDYGPIEEEEIV